jgi:hypothetical protein
MPKKATSSARERTVQVGLRIPESLLERIDAHRDRLRAQTGVVTLGRTEAALALLVRGLEAVEGRRRPG